MLTLSWLFLAHEQTSIITAGKLGDLYGFCTETIYNAGGHFRNKNDLGSSKPEAI